MRCLKCLKDIDGNVRGVGLKGIKPNQHLLHLGNWNICDGCFNKSDKDSKEYSSNYYYKNKERYRKLHKGYKSRLTDSYVANVIVEKSSLKAKDIPQEMVEARRQYMKLNRIIKKDG